MAWERRFERGTTYATYARRRDDSPTEGDMMRDIRTWWRIEYANAIGLQKVIYRRAASVAEARLALPAYARPGATVIRHEHEPVDARFCYCGAEVTT